MKNHIKIAIGVGGLLLLGGCSCYPNIKSVEPKPKPEKAAQGDTVKVQAPTARTEQS